LIICIAPGCTGTVDPEYARAALIVQVAGADAVVGQHHLVGHATHRGAVESDRPWQCRWTLKKSRKYF